MTEEEAKTKWCPFARVDSTASNRTDASGAYAGWPPCIGSACMAWRGRVVTRFDNGEDYHEGHCGLAGEPTP